MYMKVFGRQILMCLLCAVPFGYVLPFPFGVILLRYASAEGYIYSLGSYITLNRQDMRSKFGYTMLAHIHLIGGKHEYSKRRGSKDA